MLQIHSCTMLFSAAISEILHLIRKHTSNGISGPDVAREHMLQGVLTVLTAMPLG